MIPQFDSCRFITIEQIRENIHLDQFNYKSVRVLGRILQLQDPKTGYCIIESLEKGKSYDSVIAQVKPSNKEAEADVQDDDVDIALNEELMANQKNDWHILHVDTY